jgi:hypothetical protein
MSQFHEGPNYTLGANFFSSSKILLQHLLLKVDHRCQKHNYKLSISVCDRSDKFTAGVVDTGEYIGDILPPVLNLLPVTIEMGC